MIKKNQRPGESLLRFVLAQILAFISNLIPKNDKKVLFFSDPDYSDNAKFLYQRMIEVGLDKQLDLIWAVRTGAKAKCVTRNVFNSRYIYHILTSKYLVSTHEVPYWKSKNQVLILLWHGFPTKREYFDTIKRKLIKKATRPRINHIIASSPLGGVLSAAKFQIPSDTILVFGEPRCDVLFQADKDPKKTLEQILGETITNKRLLLYLPTFRDYDPEASNKILTVLLESKEFTEFLKQSNSLFLFKPHIYDDNCFTDYQSENIRVITNRKLRQFDITLYDFIQCVDVMVTDYSSVSRDYLLLNRPIVFYVPDLEQYSEKRGFLLEPFELWAPGDKARTVRELTEAIDEAIREPKRWGRERLRLRDIMFQYKDGKSSERIINHFWGLRS